MPSIKAWHSDKTVYPSIETFFVQFSKISIQTIFIWLASLSNPLQHPLHKTNQRLRQPVTFSFTSEQHEYPNPTVQKKSPFTFSSPNDWLAWKTSFLKFHQQQFTQIQTTQWVRQLTHRNGLHRSKSTRASAETGFLVARRWRTNSHRRFAWFVIGQDRLQFKTLEVSGCSLILVY